VTVGQVAQALRPAFAESRRATGDPSDETREVNVRLAPEARQRAADLGNCLWSSPDPMVSRVRCAWSDRDDHAVSWPGADNALDGDLVVTVQANTSDRSLTEVMKDINARIAKIPMPPGVHMTAGGESESQARFSAASSPPSASR